ncbi:MAG: DUF3347 domain-containing protein [Cyclobacteriaceae bacterium]|nr:DUF3347 domain-containing protein [Cyclobacteriaceae bacterium]
MKKAPFYIILVTILAFSCNSKPTDKQGNSDETTQPDSTALVEKALIEEKDQILHKYYELKDALVASDLKLAQGKAEELSTALKEHGNSGEVLLMSQAIAGAQELKDQRVAFEKLSREIYAMAKNQYSAIR